jgi:hypothetical protein
MSHNMSLSLDLSDSLLASQRQIHDLRTRLADTEDTLLLVMCAAATSREQAA